MVLVACDCGGGRSQHPAEGEVYEMVEQARAGEKAVREMG